ncbi:MLP-like protein 423 [Selaginella moellendorffii]|uniref:MLP-like protein 423 n=1 Tax=Selaginella moellendorffii TaxID=88036 RepID=UPI000D1CD422|nr:MLP-like protein 423 [Selaginella moellendorffii]|eukprot:XP_024539055.1 MLP-like protein 423 [Selaginella moellendorffii]
MVVANVKVEIILNVNCDRAWEAFKDSSSWLPRMMPNVIQSYEYDGGRRGAGSLRRVTYGPDFPAGSFSLQKILAEDNNSMTSTYTLVGGSLASKYRHYVATVRFRPGPADRSSTTVASWSLDYELRPTGTSSSSSSRDDRDSTDNAASRSQQSALDAFKALEQYLLSSS